MRAPLPFTLEHFLLFEATLLQYAFFVTASTSPSNLSTSPAASCKGCQVAAAPSLLSFPKDVHEITSSLSVTVIPYITVYQDGQNVTNYSTYTKYASGQSSQGLATTTATLTWETLGTTLTYPTTYMAFPAASAGASAKSDGSCMISLTSIHLTTTLIYPLTGASESLVSSAQSYIDSLPTVSAIVSPNKPADCSWATSQTVFASLASSESEAAVTHTSVQFLTSQGQAVITKASGTAPPAQSETAGGGGTGSGGSNGGQGGSANGGSGGQTTKSTSQSSTPILNWGGSTITEGPNGVWNIGGQTVTAGGSAQVIDGTTVSIGAGGTVAVLNGQTSSLSSAATASTNNSPDGQVPVSLTTWFAGMAIGFLGMFVGVYL